VRRTIIALSLLIILLVPFLNACDAGDADILIGYAKLWAMAHDITDEDGSVNYGAATRFIVGEAGGFGTTGDKEGDAVIDSARTLKDIRQAENEADKGWNSFYSGANVEDSVLPHYNQAIKLRPNDWTYYNERGIAQLENYDSPNLIKNANADFAEAKAITAATPAEYLKMLKQRASNMEKIVGHEYNTQVTPSKYVFEEQSRTYGELYTLTKENNYLLLKQQADTKLKEGYFTTQGTSK
jgi:hypothetical protein